MTKKIVFGVAVVALAMVVMAPSVSASCPGPRTANTYNGGTGAFTYWHAPSGDASGTLVSQAWQLGAPGVFNSAGCPTFLYFAAGGIGLGADFSTCGVGCPAPGSTLAVLAQKISDAPASVTDFLLATVAETPTGGSNFDYSGQGAHNMIRLPAPTVLSSGPRAGTLVPLHVSIPGISAAFFGPGASSAVTGYKIVAARAATEPTRDAALFNAPVTGGSLSSAGGAPVADALVQLDCGNNPGEDGWVALQVQFEGGSVLSGAVSAPKRVHCQGTLADPKFKPVKKGAAVGHTQH